MTSITEPTVLDPDLDLTVRTTDDGTVVLSGDVAPDGAWHFTPDEALRLADALTRHAGGGAR